MPKNFKELQRMSLLTLTKISSKTRFWHLDSVVDCDLHFPSLREIHVAFVPDDFRTPKEASSRFIGRHCDQVVFHASMMVISRTTYDGTQYPFAMTLYLTNDSSSSSDHHSIKVRSLDSVPIIYKTLLTHLWIEREEEEVFESFIKSIQEVGIMVRSSEEYSGISSVVRCLSSSYSLSRLQRVDMNLYTKGLQNCNDRALREITYEYPCVKTQINMRI